jgi:hypothetical protein
LFDLTFLRRGANIVLIGNPGLGKTFLSKVFGWNARYSWRLGLAQDGSEEVLGLQCNSALFTWSGTGTGLSRPLRAHLTKPYRKVNCSLVEDRLTTLDLLTASCDSRNNGVDLIPASPDHANE